jgi:3-hydroxymyristoyl/3-hydroxydecanoyl-(acyl carrier protein) dehydratase
MSAEHSIDAQNSYTDEQLRALDWKNLDCLNGRLLELHGQGKLGNERFAKLPLKPILCIDQIDLIDDKQIRATFTFPKDQSDWAFDRSESLEMLFQDQLDQLVGFWGCRKADGIGRALSSGACKLVQSLDFSPGKTVHFELTKRKWIENSNGGGTAVFNGKILDEDGQPMLETRNVIVGILHPDDVNKLRQQHGGKLGVEGTGEPWPANLIIPLFDSPIDIDGNAPEVASVNATQQIDPTLWPLRYHFTDDPVVPGNFGTHGMIALLKHIASTTFGLDKPIFRSLATKKFAGMIFEDPKQIRFELLGVTSPEPNTVQAAEANLYLETQSGELMIDTPIYVFKDLTVASPG